MKFTKLLLIFLVTSCQSFIFAAANFGFGMPASNESRGTKRRLVFADESEKDKEKKNKNEQEINKINDLLFNAVNAFNLEDIKSALSNGAQINANWNGTLPILSFAVGRVNSILLKENAEYAKTVLDVFEYLIDNGANIDAVTIKPERKLGEMFFCGHIHIPIDNALIKAIKNYCYKVAELLIKKGSNVDLKDDENKTALCHINLFDQTDNENFDKVVKQLIELSDLDQKLGSTFLKPIFYFTHWYPRNDYTERLIQLQKRIENVVELIIEKMLRENINVNFNDFFNYLIKHKPELADNNWIVFVEKKRQFHKASIEAQLLERTKEVLPNTLAMLTLSYLDIGTHKDGHEVTDNETNKLETGNEPLPAVESANL